MCLLLSSKNDIYTIAIYVLTHLTFAIKNCFWIMLKILLRMKFCATCHWFCKLWLFEIIISLYIKLLNSFEKCFFLNFSVQFPAHFTINRLDNQLGQILCLVIWNAVVLLQNAPRCIFIFMKQRYWNDLWGAKWWLTGISNRNLICWPVCFW